MPTRRHAIILPAIVLSQLAGTAIWFSGNAVLAELAALWPASQSMVGWITSAVQLGFITGTLGAAFFSIADRFSPRWVFLFSTLAGAATNLLTITAGHSPFLMLGLRFASGVFLAGIYPVGMKIAAGWYEKGLGNAMGFLIGALVLGTAFPHLVRGGLSAISWQAVMTLSSGVCLAGGLLMAFLVPDGPHLVRGSQFQPKAVAAIFSHPPLRAAAFGYFGHMWELYGLWAFLPLYLAGYAAADGNVSLNVPLWSFITIGIGSAGCITGGMLSRRLGSATVAVMQLRASCICCLCSPMFFAAPPVLFLPFMLIWGVAVVGDSPQFSTIVARTAPRELVGSALTLVNSIGFSITVVSLVLLQWLAARLPLQFLLVILSLGPAAGIFCMRTHVREG